LTRVETEAVGRTQFGVVSIGNAEAAADTAIGAPTPDGTRSSVALSEPDNVSMIVPTTHPNNDLVTDKNLFLFGYFLWAAS
jgi:hypothetical protein